MQTEQRTDSAEHAVVTEVARAARWARYMDQILDMILDGTRDHGDEFALIALRGLQRDARQDLRRKYGLRLRALRDGRHFWWIPTRLRDAGQCCCKVPAVHIGQWCVYERGFRFVWNAHAATGRPIEVATDDVLGVLKILCEWWGCQVYSVATCAECGQLGESGVFGVAGWAATRLSLTKNSRLRAALPVGKIAGGYARYAHLPGPALLAVTEWFEADDRDLDDLRNSVAHILENEAPEAGQLPEPLS